MSADEVKRLVDQAQAKHEQGDHEGAIADYTKAIEIAPDDEEAYFGRGNSYLDLENYEKCN
jgi:tetratricopeptide (TPR) repeat protein